MGNEGDALWLSGDGNSLCALGLAPLFCAPMWKKKQQNKTTNLCEACLYSVAALPWKPAGNKSRCACLRADRGRTDRGQGTGICPVLPSCILKVL